MAKTTQAGPAKTREGSTLTSGPTRKAARRLAQSHGARDEGSCKCLSLHQQQSARNEDDCRRRHVSVVSACRANVQQDVPLELRLRLSVLSGCGDECYLYVLQQSAISVNLDDAVGKNELQLVCTVVTRERTPIGV